MKKILVTYNNKDYDCIQKDKTIILMFDNFIDVPRGNGWCLIKHDSFEQKCLICRSKDNRLLYNNNCSVYDIVFSCYLDVQCGNYVIEFYSNLFDKVFTRFGKKRSFELIINDKIYDVILCKKNNGPSGSIGVMVFKCNAITDSDLIILYNYVSSFMKFISLGTCSYPSSFFVNDVEGFCSNNKFYDWMKIDFLHINYMNHKDLKSLAQYVADNSQFLINLFFSDENTISTKDVGSLYSIIDKTLDDQKPTEYSKQIEKKRDAVKYKVVLSLIKDFGEKNGLCKRKEFCEFYSGVSCYGLSIKEKIEYVLDDYLRVFKNDDEMYLSKKEDLLDFAKAINGVRTFDAHGDDIKSNIVGLGLYYSAFLQELAYYSIFKFSLHCSNKTIKNVFSNCFSFVSINSNIWIRNKIKI